MSCSRFRASSSKRNFLLYAASLAPGTLGHDDFLVPLISNKSVETSQLVSNMFYSILTVSNIPWALHLRQIQPHLLLVSQAQLRLVDAKGYQAAE